MKYCHDCLTPINRYSKEEYCPLCKRDRSLTKRKTSMRCKVCNTLKILNIDKLNSDTTWECETCGNQVDVNGHVVSLT